MKRHKLLLTGVFVCLLGIGLAMAWRPTLDWITHRIILPTLQAKLQAQVTFREIGFSLFPPRVIVSDVELKRPDGPLRYLGVKRISIQPGAGPIFIGKFTVKVLEIDRPSIQLVPAVGKNEASKPKEQKRLRLPTLRDLIRIQVDEIIVRDASLSVELPAEDLRIEVASGNATYRGRGSKERWSWKGDGMLTRGDRAFRLDAVTIVADRQGQSVSLEKFDVESGGLKAHVEGLAYPNAELKLEAGVDLNAVENALDDLGHSRKAARALRTDSSSGGRFGGNGTLFASEGRSNWRRRA